MTDQARADRRAERRVGRWAAASARRGPWGARAARRLLAAAAARDARALAETARIARTPGHRHRERAKETIALCWARTRDAGLRAAVLETGAVAAEAPSRLQTLALVGRLGEWAPSDAEWAPTLLADPDPNVRRHAEDACRDATGPHLAALWAACGGPGSRLRGVLLANAAPPPGPALDLLWDEWLTSPAHDVFDALVRWRRPAADERLAATSVIALEPDADVLLRPPCRAAVLDALERRGHPVREIAAARIRELDVRPLVEEVCERALTRPELAELCVEHRLAPAAPVRRALFYLLTGQPEQHRALDPDGGLLSLAYTSASDDQRALARKAMLTEGDLDLVRVIVGEDRRERIPTMTAEEIRYIAEQLAARRAWDDLWALVRDVPIATGAALFRLFDGWTPRDDDGRRLFEMFRATDLAAVRAGLHPADDGTWRAVRRARLRFRHHVDSVSFAPDGPFLAIAGRPRVAGVFDLRTARLTERYDWFDAPVGSVLHVGNGAVVAGERSAGQAAACRVLRCAGGDVRPLHEGAASITSLALVGADGGFAGGTRDGEVLLGSPDGRVRVRHVSEFGLGRRQWPRQVVAHRGSGRLALLGRSVHLVHPGGESAVSAHPGRAVRFAEFIDAYTVVCADPHGWATLLRVEDGHRVPSRQARIQGCAGLGVLPHLGEPVITDRSGDLHFLSGTTLDHLDTQHGPGGGRPTGLTVSPNGEFLAAGHGDGHVDLYDLRLREVPRIARRPLAELVPRHLGPVGAALSAPAVRGRDRAVLELLQACLEHRFRFDVELGGAVQLAAGVHDISL
ncbi:WD40 repeat domain-containing protein [Actinomadura chibensis]|uniref:WD40 repeat domain-containing protein n=1 Tax=Actinomadura chibensis TaxID=392828 RepID=A0A5D0NME0_9ACTN|nr:hypothetical protein [Actinomadura chibensis]TYB45637.1 hypothetical protein FXF69_19640 [Actinomadura chibensis]